MGIADRSARTTGVASDSIDTSREASAVHGEACRPAVYYCPCERPAYRATAFTVLSCHRLRPVRPGTLCGQKNNHKSWFEPAIRSEVRLTRTASARGGGGLMTMQLTNSICLRAALLVIGMAVIGRVPVASAQSENVCARTVQVGNAIQAASGGEGCTRLTLHHLREITTLDLRNQGISSLRASDFDGLRAA